MDDFEFWSVFFSMLAIVSSVYAIVVSNKANSIAESANRMNKRMFKRQGVIDLHIAWSTIRNIDENQLITPDIVNAVNTMSLTAMLWNHDVMEKPILYQSYWNSYRQLYEKLSSIETIPPKMNARCKDLITSEITKAYNSMNSANISQTLTTEI